MHVCIYCNELAIAGDAGDKLYIVLLLELTDEINHLCPILHRYNQLSPSKG